MLHSLRHCLGYLKRLFFGLPAKGENQSEASPASIWCLVANIVEVRPYGPEGKETKRGTKHFAAGAKIYCFPAQWGDGYEQIRVVGRHRGSHRFVTMIINSEWLTNWRAQNIYSPAVIEKLAGAWEEAAKYSSFSPEQQIERYVKMMKEREDKRKNSSA